MAEEVRAEAWVNTDMIWMGEVKEGLCPRCHAGCAHTRSRSSGEQDSPLNPLPKTHKPT